MRQTPAGPIQCGVSAVPVYGRVSASESARVQRIARRHGARFVQVKGPTCACGYGCRDGCERRVWLEVFAGRSVDAAGLLAEIGPIRLTGGNASWRFRADVLVRGGHYYLQIDGGRS